MTILTAILTSVISSFLFGRFYLNLQYHKSNAGFRQQQIIDATNYLVKEFREKGSIDPLSHIRFKYSLSKVIEKFILVYGLTDDHNNPDEFPLFQSEDGDGFKFFDDNVRQVMIDLNNNAFIGWINWVPNVKKLTTLWELCFCLEKIVTRTELIKDKKIDEKLLILKSADDAELQQDISYIRQNHYLIRTQWFKWLSLNGL